MSAVSKKLTPASSAADTTATVPSAETDVPNWLQPRAISDTRTRSVRPSADPLTWLSRSPRQPTSSAGLGRLPPPHRNVLGRDVLERDLDLHPDLHRERVDIDHVGADDARPRPLIDPAHADHVGHVLNERARPSVDDAVGVHLAVSAHRRPRHID